MHPAPFERVVEEHRAAACALVRKLRPDLDPATPEPTLLLLAMPGLLEAHRRFQPDRGVEFWSFAYHRVRGAVLDELYESIGRPRGAEQRVVTALAQPRIWGEELGKDSTNELPPLLAGDGAQRVFRDHERSPERALEEEEVKARLAEEMERLATRERVVLHGMYFEDRPLDELAAQLGGFSRSWVSRVHTKALRLLRERLSR